MDREEDRPQPLRVQADLLAASRASLSYRSRPPRPDSGALPHRIEERYTATPSTARAGSRPYGARKAGR